MGIKQELENDLHDAMRNKDELKKDTIRMVLASIKLAEIDKRKELDDQSIISVLFKEVKMRNETLEELSTANRPDLIEKAQSELNILNKYLPKQLSEAEIKQRAMTVIQSVSATQPSDIGKVLKVLIPQLQGQASSEIISNVVMKLLS